MMINSKLNRYRIKVYKTNLTTSNLQILNGLFDATYLNQIQQQPFHPPYHYEFTEYRLSFIILSFTEIQELVSKCFTGDLDLMLKQFYTHLNTAPSSDSRIGNNDGFIIFESLGHSLILGTKNVNNNNNINNSSNNVGMTGEFQKFQLHYLNYNFKFLFTYSQNETYQLMDKCVDGKSLCSQKTNIKNEIFESQFKKNEKIKLLSSIDGLSNSDCQFLLKENEISNILTTLQKEKNKFINSTKTTNTSSSINNNNNKNVSNNNSNEPTTTSKTIDRSILQVYKFLQKDSRI